MGYEIWKTGAAMCLAAAVLTGCEETALLDDAASQDDYNDLATAYNDLRTDVQALPLSTAVDMPTVGSATYDGYATVLVDTAIDSALVGDALITADFGKSELNGNLTNFVGTVDGSAYSDFNGSIAIKDGEIGVASASALTGDIKGSLSNGEDLVSINGGVEGNFRSDGAVNAAGLTARDTTGTDFIVNGRERDGDLGIVAIR